MTKLVRNNWHNLDLRRELSTNFRVKVYSSSDCGKTLNSLVGYSGLIDLIGLELADKFITNAILSDQQNVVNNLRRGLKITFYSK